MCCGATEVVYILRTCLFRALGAWGEMHSLGNEREILVYGDVCSIEFPSQEGENNSYVFRMN